MFLGVFGCFFVVLVLYDVFGCFGGVFEGVLGDVSGGIQGVFCVFFVCFSVLLSASFFCVFLVF